MIKAISTLYLAFFEMCRFRRKPQDLPHSLDLLIVCVVIYTLINFLLGLNTSTAFRAAQASFLETLSVSIITIIILKLNRHTERWLKTLLAIMGTGSVIGLFALPLFMGLFMLDSGELLQALILMVYMVLLIWSIAIMGHILRHALETSMGFGVLFALVYIVITSILIGVLVPEMELQQ